MFQCPLKRYKCNGSKSPHKCSMVNICIDSNIFISVHHSWSADWKLKTRLVLTYNNKQSWILTKHMTKFEGKNISATPICRIKMQEK